MWPLFKVTGWLLSKILKSVLKLLLLNMKDACERTVDVKLAERSFKQSPTVSWADSPHRKWGMQVAEYQHTIHMTRLEQTVPKLKTVYWQSFRYICIVLNNDATIQPPPPLFPHFNHVHFILYVHCFQMFMLKQFNTSEKPTSDKEATVPFVSLSWFGAGTLSILYS